MTFFQCYCFRYEIIYHFVALLLLCIPTHYQFSTLKQTSFNYLYFSNRLNLFQLMPVSLSINDIIPWGNIMLLSYVGISSLSLLWSLLWFVLWSLLWFSALAVCKFVSILSGYALENFAFCWYAWSNVAEALHVWLNSTLGSPIQKIISLRVSLIRYRHVFVKWYPLVWG